MLTAFLMSIELGRTIDASIDTKSALEQHAQLERARRAALAASSTAKPAPYKIASQANPQPR